MIVSSFSRIRTYFQSKVHFTSFVVLTIVGYFIFFAAPHNFPVHSVVFIPEGATLSQVAELLEGGGIIKNQFLYKALIVLAPGKSYVRWGDYFFPTRDNIFTISYRSLRGKFGIDPIRIVIFEGLNNNEIANLLKYQLPNFNEEDFLRDAKDLEGYLFPDTYEVLPTLKNKEVITLLSSTFEQKTRNLKAEAHVKGLTWEDVVIMASLLEEEASTLETKKEIAKILWRRLAIGMPLQVDAVFTYIFGKNGFDITLKDLEIDSPYNTYKYAGLPIGPITNPGLESIEAALYNTETPYLYYLSDRKGVTYYAEDFEQHKINKATHLQ